MRMIRCCEAGVGRPRGLGRLSLRPSPALYRHTEESINKYDSKLGKGDTYVITDPCPTTFSFRSVDDLPVLRFVHPKAVLRALDPTRGCAPGASPKVFSRFGSTSITRGENGFSASRDGAPDMRLLLRLTSICWRTSTGVRCASGLMGCMCGDGGVTALLIAARA